jgi:hypothetical protein
MAASQKSKRSLEDVKAELMKDKHTRDIAKTLGMKLEEYVALVLEYVKDPNKEPVVNVIPEAEVKKHGGATMEDVKAWFEKVASGEVKIPGTQHDGDSFQTEKTNSKVKKIKKATGA